MYILSLVLPVLPCACMTFVWFTLVPASTVTFMMGDEHELHNVTDLELVKNMLAEMHRKKLRVEALGKEKLCNTIAAGDRTI